MKKMSRDFKMETLKRQGHLTVLPITYHHEFVNPPLIDSKPFQAHCFQEVTVELNTNFDVWKAVNQ